MTVAEAGPPKIVVIVPAFEFNSAAIDQLDAQINLVLLCKQLGRNHGLELTPGDLFC